ncbi:hypothetical protein BX616_003338, partial [Lobosporangium transversale]
MASILKDQAKKAVDVLYDLLFDAPKYDPFPPACTDSYSFDGTKKYCIRHNNDELDNNIYDTIMTTTSIVDNAAPTSIGKKLQAMTNLEYWREFHPSNAWNNFVSHIRMDMPDIQEMWARFALDHWAEHLGLKPHILFLLCLLPLVVIFLTFCIYMGQTTDYNGLRSGLKTNLDSSNSTEGKEDQQAPASASISSPSPSEQVSEGNKSPPRSEKDEVKVKGK